MTISAPHHSFDVNLAAAHSIEEAILIHHFQHWIMVNARLNQNFQEDRFWTYQTLEWITAHFPYWSVDQVRRIIQKLVDKKILLKGNFAENSHNRTIWYALTDQGFINPKMHMAESPYGNGGIAKCIYKEQILEPDTRIMSPPKRRSTATPIRFDEKKNEWEGIREEDLRSWKTTFTAISVEKELNEAKIWAKSVYRKNYRRSLDTWMSNANKNHTTAYSPPMASQTKPATPDELKQHKDLALKWERIQAEHKKPMYWIDAHQDKVIFGMPENTGYEVLYDLSHDEFMKQCKMALTRMRID
jgi:hypothetical protein